MKIYRESDISKHFPQNIEKLNFYRELEFLDNFQKISIGHRFLENILIQEYNRILMRLHLCILHKSCYHRNWPVTDILIQETSVFR